MITPTNAGTRASSLIFMILITGLGRSASSWRLLCNASTGTPSGTRRLCSEWIAANDLGLHNPRSTPATPSGWNYMKICWRPSAWNAYRTGTEPSC